MVPFCHDFSVFSIKEKFLKPLFHNLNQVNNQVLEAFQRVLAIGISDICCKTTVNCYCGFIRTIIKNPDNSWHNSVVEMT